MADGLPVFEHDLLTAEEIFLLVTDDKHGFIYPAQAAERNLAGALILDLVLDDCIQEVFDGAEFVGETHEHPLLDETLEYLHAEPEPHHLGWWVKHLPRRFASLSTSIAEGLVHQGILSRQRTKALGMFPVTHYPEHDPAPEQGLRERLLATLFEDHELDFRDAWIIAVLYKQGWLNDLVPKHAGLHAKVHADDVAKQITKDLIDTDYFYAEISGNPWVWNTGSGGDNSTAAHAAAQLSMTVACATAAAASN